MFLPCFRSEAIAAAAVGLIASTLPSIGPGTRALALHKPFTALVVQCGRLHFPLVFRLNV